MPPLQAELFAEFVALLTPFLPTAAAARNLLTLALGPASTTPGTLNLEGSPRDRAVVIVERLSRDELWRVLNKANASVDWEAALEQVRPRLFADKPTVFISYAHLDQAHAERVEAALLAAGFTVFIDKTALRGGDWDAMIETALRQHDRLVLLLSPHSMPHRKEVHREWFYFDQHRKPIHPIMIADCDLHSRMLAYQHRDGRPDLDAALGQVIGDLRQPFQLVTDAPPRDPLQDYYQKRIDDLTQPRYALDRRFVRLTLLIDQGDKADGMRWINPQPNRRFDDLRAVLDELKAHMALVVLGAPGSGKSTLLRRLQLDECVARMSDGGRVIPFFAPLNAYRGDQAPLDWLATRWAETAPGLPPLPELLKAGRMLLLLDALNEMPGNNARGLVGRWREFLHALPPGNRAVITCRTLDYSAPLSAPPEFSVPQIELQPMTPEQILEFLQAYLPDRAETVWLALKDTPQMALFSAPFFLRLLVDQVDRAGTIPEGRAALFAGFVRGGIEREIGREHPLFVPGDLLTQRDHQQMATRRWETAHALPARGLLIPKLSALAYQMQTSGTRREGGQVLVDYDTACRLIDHARYEDILKAGEALHVVDEDIARDEVRYFHQLLQEFFAARVIAVAPNPALVHVEWQVDRVSPSLEATLKSLADGDPLPPLDPTGWEETMLTAAAMSADADTFVRGLMTVNLPLAGSAAAASDVHVSDALKREIQDALIARSQDFANADLRARIAAGQALGNLGDPRFERKTGTYGDYLLPPLVAIPDGTYPIGDDNSSDDDEKPAHTVTLDTFQIGQFAVTNAEYALFIEAGGYEDEQWWDTDEARAWRDGTSTSEGQKDFWREYRKFLNEFSIVKVEEIAPQLPYAVEDTVKARILNDIDFEEWLSTKFPAGKRIVIPEYWDDTRFNNPAQPVVGVTWFEARAYCAWLSAQTGQTYALPAEAQFEAAARGTDGRAYPYGSEFDATRSNTIESHIRRTTPVGIFDNATPEGALDLTGNAFTWTTTIYDQKAFPYPYRADDEREDVNSTSVRRVLRGGSWIGGQGSVRAASRLNDYPSERIPNDGFRLVCVVASHH